MMKKYGKAILLVLLTILLLFIGGCEAEQSVSVITLEDVPAYSGEPYVEIDQNIPDFTDEDRSEVSFEHYGELDELGRCTQVFANIGLDLMPKEKRGSIGQVKPTGWKTTKYDFVDGKYLYNRCHLIGYQLTGENANRKNLITGTRYMNTEGMLPFENMVADYIHETQNHVLYRVTPLFDEDDLLARGVVMEGKSVEDEGEGISFHVFVYNIQPGVDITYSDGSSRRSSMTRTENQTVLEIRGNSRSKIYHCPGQSSYEDMFDSKHLVIFHSEEEAQAAGYRKAKK